MTPEAWLLWAVALLVVIVTALILIATSPLRPLIVQELEAIVVQRFGKTVRVITGPGLHWTCPIDTFKTFDWKVREDRDGGGFQTSRMRGYRVPFGRTFIYDMPKVQCTTLDHVVMEPDIAVQYAVVDAELAVKSSNALKSMQMRLQLAIQEKMRDCKIEQLQIPEAATQMEISIEKSCKEPVQRDLGICITRVMFQSMGFPVHIAGLREQRLTMAARIEREQAELSHTQEMERKTNMARTLVKTSIFEARMDAACKSALAVSKQAAFNDAETKAFCRTVLEQAAYWFSSGLPPVQYPYPHHQPLPVRPPPPPSSAT